MTARPNPTGQRDSIGREIKVADQTVASRASAPPPPITDLTLERPPVDPEIQDLIDDFAELGIIRSEALWVTARGYSQLSYIAARRHYPHETFVNLVNAGFGARTVAAAARSGATPDELRGRVTPGFQFGNAWSPPSPSIDQQLEVLARDVDQDDYISIRRVGGLNHAAAIELCELGVSGHLFRDTNAAYMTIGEIRAASSTDALLPEREYQHLRDHKAIVDARVRAWLEIRRHGQPPMSMSEYAALSATERLTAIDATRRGNH